MDRKKVKESHLNALKYFGVEQAKKLELLTKSQKSSVKMDMAKGVKIIKIPFSFY